MPRQNSVRFVLFNSLYHCAENRTARNFGRLFFNKGVNDIQIFLFGVGTQFCDLVFNRTNLFIFNICWFAGVKEKFIVVHKIVWLFFNWAKQILKNRKGYEPLFGEPRRARRASFPVQGGAKRRRNGKPKRRKFDTGAGDGNRTHVFFLEGRNFAIKLHPPRHFFQTILFD